MTEFIDFPILLNRGMSQPVHNQNLVLFTPYSTHTPTSEEVRIWRYRRLKPRILRSPTIYLTSIVEHE
jgi:hypothetical protein